GRRLAGLEPAVRPSRGARAPRLQERVRAGRVRVVHGLAGRRARLLVRGARRQPLPLHRVREDRRRGGSRGRTTSRGGLVSRLLIDSCEVVVTMNDADLEIDGGSILIEDGRLTWIGTGEPPGVATGTERLDGRGCVALPGLVNTHHHLFQTMT